MGKLTKRVWIFSNTELIDTMEGNSDVQLRKNSDGYYMTSPKTGNHFIKSNEMDGRVISHWEGFKINQKNI
jgi:hypothetical protein